MSKFSVDYVRETFIKNQLPETFGIDITEIGEDFMVAELTVDERHLRPGRIMNGGVSLVLLETIGSMSSGLKVDWDKQNTLGIQVSANHLGVAYPGDKLQARSTAIHIGRTTHLWEVVVTNQKGKIISNGRITMLVTDR